MKAHQPEPTSLDRIILIPVNGYANRLQAWASSSVLAAQFGVPLEIHWEPESVAPATSHDLFSSPAQGSSFVSREDVCSHLGTDPANADRYLSVLPEKRLVTLAGHDLGEQAFMADLVPALRHSCAPTTLLIIAGGKFHLPGNEDFAEQRRSFYQSLSWAHEIMERVSQTRAGRSDSLGLHIRETDRSVAAPTRQSIRRALRLLQERTGVSDVFLAADTLGARRRWQDELVGLGLHPWSTRNPDLDRSSAAAGVDALVDWVLLSQTLGVVYSRESSFGEEAVVAGGSAKISVPLTAPQRLQRYRRTTALARTALTYPQRRMSHGRNPS